MTGKGWTIFLTGITLAVVIASLGHRLSREEIIITEERDPEPLKALANTIQDELNRLEQRYEFYIQEILACWQKESDIKTQSLAAETVAVTRVSLVVSDGMPGNEFTLPVSANIENSSYIPTLRKGPLGVPETHLLLDSNIIPGTGQIDRGWFYAVPGELLYWIRYRENSAKVASIDTVKLRESINQWLQSTIPFESVRLSIKGTDRLVGPSGSVVWSLHPLERGDALPHRTITLAARAGVWRLESFDPQSTKIQYRESVYIPAFLVSGLLTLLSTFIAVAFSRAETVARQRVSFVNQASHELRTPITNILLNNELAAESVEDEPAEAIARIQLVNEETGRLSRLVDNLLTFAQCEQNTLALHERDVVPDDIILQTLNLFRSGFERIGFKVETSLNASQTIKTSPDALAQILTNLISNVEKYAKEGKWIRIESEMDGVELTIRVKDDGPGVSLQAGEQIFKPFYRQSNEISEGVSGTGLGLSISRDLAEKLGGRLDKISSQRGSAFQLVIKL